MAKRQYYYVIIYIIDTNNKMTAITLDVTAFILMHGLVQPKKQVRTDTQPPSCLQYELNGSPLPENTRLYAPSI